MGTIGPATWQEAVRKGISPTVLKSAWGPAGIGAVDMISPAMLRFVGSTHEIGLSRSSGGEVLSAAFRDFTSDLIDNEVHPDVYRDTDWSLPVEQIFLSLLDGLPPTKGLPLHLDGFKPGEIFLANGKAQTAGGGAKPFRAPKIANEKYWDLMTDLSVGLGLVCYADVWQGEDPSGGPRPLGRFVLARPTSIFSASAARKVADARTGAVMEIVPFSARERRHPITDEALENPALVYGSNLASLDERKTLGRVKAPTIEVVCADGNKIIKARWPEKARATKVDAKGLWASEEVRQQVVTGFTSEADLKEIARQVFEETGRADMNTEWTTSSLASYGGDNYDPDLLELKPGSPVEIYDAEEGTGQETGQGAIGTSPRIAAYGEKQLTAWLVKLGHDKKTAADVAAEISGQDDNAVRQWYVQTIEHGWSADDGYSCHGTAINYQVARIEKELKAGTLDIDLAGGLA
jgi:hypothetical protein